MIMNYNYEANNLKKLPKPLTFKDFQVDKVLFKSYKSLIFYK